MLFVEWPPTNLSKTNFHIKILQKKNTYFNLLQNIKVDSSV